MDTDTEEEYNKVSETGILDFKEVCLDRTFGYAIMNTEKGVLFFAGLLNDMRQKIGMRRENMAEAGGI